MRKLFIMLVVALGLSACATTKDATALRENGVGLRHGDRVVKVDVRDGIACFTIENKRSRQVWFETVYVGDGSVNY